MSRDLSKAELRALLCEIIEPSVLQSFDLDFLSISEKDLIKILYNDIQTLKFDLKETLTKAKGNV